MVREGTVQPKRDGTRRSLSLVASGSTRLRHHRKCEVVIRSSSSWLEASELLLGFIEFFGEMRLPVSVLHFLPSMSVRRTDELLKARLQGATCPHRDALAQLVTPA